MREIFNGMIDMILILRKSNYTPKVSSGLKIIIEKICAKNLI